ncbi:MAG TPA: ABC transporter permease subunit [Thermoanaerobaculia bacterium]|nr:ABC transporter permease subunit [Thermoanaerobaculia bacterium]
MLGPLQPPPPLAPVAGTAVVLGSRAPLGVIATIARHEAGRLVSSFRFPLVSVLLVALLALTAVTSSERYDRDRRAQAAVAGNHAASLQGLTVDGMAEVRHPAVRPPWRLSFAVDGGQAATPDVYEQALSPLVTPELRRAERGNDRLPGPSPLDWMFAIRVVLSLAAFLLGYDAICGERQSGTLKLVMSYPIPRWKVVAGKLAALWSCLAAPFLLGVALCGALLFALGEAPRGTADLVKAGLVVLLGLWAAAFFALAALTVSAAARTPSTSLSVLALLWIGAVVGVPALGYLLAHRLAPLPTEGKVGQRMQEVQRRTAREHAGREGRWRAAEWAAADGYAWERASARAETERRRLQEEVRWWVIGRKLGQARLAHGISSLSPALLIQDLGERLTGSGVWRDEAFLAQARAFRSVLEDRARKLDLADAESPHILFFKGYLSRRPVPPGAVPPFTFREVPVAGSLAAAGPAAALLALETLLLGGFLFARRERE